MDRTTPRRPLQTRSVGTFAGLIWVEIDVSLGMVATWCSWIAFLVAPTLTVGAGVVTASAQGKDVLVFAASSLSNALDEITAQWHRATGKNVAISYGASGTLIRQIEQGARADLFISADPDWMDYGQQRNLINPETRSNLIGNRIVLIAPQDADIKMHIEPGFDLASLLNGGRLAMGNVEAVPAGEYGKFALERLGCWESVKDKVVQAEDVRAALRLVSRGEAALGIVYQTDAMSDRTVKIVGVFPKETHPPIIYPIALTRQAISPDAREFLNYLRSPSALTTFERQGFTLSASGG